VRTRILEDLRRVFTPKRGKNRDFCPPEKGERKMSHHTREKKWLRNLVTGLRTILVLLLLCTALEQISVVRGGSMEPGVQDGDRILKEPWSYTFSEPERGDVVILRYPLDPSIDYIKRIIGVPGDRVFLAGGCLWLNRELVGEPYVAEVDRSSYINLTVGPSEYFVLGDNRPRASDSREFGLVPRKYIRGRVDMCLWPLSRAGWID